MAVKHATGYTHTSSRGREVQQSEAGGDMVLLALTEACGRQGVRRRRTASNDKPTLLVKLLSVIMAAFRRRDARPRPPPLAATDIMALGGPCLALDPEMQGAQTFMGSATGGVFQLLALMGSGKTSACVEWGREERAGMDGRKKACPAPAQP